MASIFFYISDFAKWDLWKTDKEQMEKKSLYKDRGNHFSQLKSNIFKICISKFKLAYAHSPGVDSLQESRGEESEVEQKTY